MTCVDCACDEAECLTEDRVRVCVSCLYERTAKQRDELRHEVERLRAWKPVGTYSMEWNHEQERLRLVAEVEKLKLEVKNLTLALTEEEYD